ncbi:MAG: hypothetical protein E7411_03410 [Ruminococcaceae bacterium]|nr:hypothetical protein [Oscillospiraceae bacterium]
MNENDIILMLGELESSTKAAHKRIDSIEILTRSVYELATSVKAMQKDLCEITERIRSVEETPKKRWDIVISALISGIVGFAVKGMFI